MHQAHVHGQLHPSPSREHPVVLADRDSPRLGLAEPTFRCGRTEPAGLRQQVDGAAEPVSADRPSCNRTSTALRPRRRSRPEPPICTGRGRPRPAARRPCRRTRATPARRRRERRAPGRRGSQPSRPDPSRPRAVASRPPALLQARHAASGGLGCAPARRRRAHESPVSAQHRPDPGRPGAVRRRTVAETTEPGLLRTRGPVVTSSVIMKRFW